MGKYNYDKSSLKGLGVGAFLGEVKLRESKIAEAEPILQPSVFNSNVLASSLHPAHQHAVVTKVIEHKDAKTFILSPDASKGCSSLAYFRAGQYVSVELDIDGRKCNKPYSLASGPKDALGAEGNTYALTIKDGKDIVAGAYILNNWKVGTEVKLSGPLGDFYYDSLRDKKDVVALAGGSGITPFFSMAWAIAEGMEDFNLTILYGSRNSDNILLKEELDKAVAKANGKVKVVNVLSDEEKEGFEHGFLSADLIQKYAPKGDYTVYECGPKVMYAFVEKEIAKLNLPKRLVRFEVSGEFGDPAQDPKYPKDAVGKAFNLTVIVRGEETKTTVAANETIIMAIEKAGIRAPSQCRSGQCGWCHSRLVSGDVFVPEKADGRRAGDKKFGWIHPCATYALSDVVVEVFPIAD